MNITLRQLTYFKALAEHGNFGRAALAERVSQPALSMQIKGLEDMLGAPLVERHARSVVLTPFGRRILKHAEAVLDQMRELEEAARWKDGLAGRLALGVIPTVAPYLLPVCWRGYGRPTSRWMCRCTRPRPRGFWPIWPPGASMRRSWRCPPGPRG